MLACVSPETNLTCLSSLRRDAAWELLESRGEKGAKYPPYRCTPASKQKLPVPTGTLDSLKEELQRVLLHESKPESPVWQRKKAAVSKIREHMRRAWQEGKLDGSAHEEALKTLAHFT